MKSYPPRKEFILFMKACSLGARDGFTQPIFYKRFDYFIF